MALRFEGLTRDNRVVLEDVPKMLQTRTAQCVAESDAYQKSSATYTRTCARLKREIYALTHEGTIAKAHDVMHDFHRSGLGAPHPAVASTMSNAELRAAKLHAAEIALFVGQNSRAKRFHDMQEHIDALQSLIQKHNVALDRLTFRARALA